ncbi:hypothetical protein RhiirA5_420819 [Rhizophagus irregularis]|uniref:Ion transport domain-containing protein n=3 Tax=Rhizophagus irregularis TaxID=588596 RepID=A0A2N0PFC0_9GLOM|nr:hypothetical protein RhiirA5_420819 [Rhizophagus irregularis]
MSEENTIQISDDVNEIVSHNSRDPHHAHNGKQISLVLLSPNGTYIVTYSEDDKSIEGWIVDNSKLILDSQVNVPEESKNIFMIKVNDSKIVCFLCKRNHEVCIEIFQISNEHRPFKLNPKLKKWQPTIFFQKNGNLVINTSFKILIYSPHDEINDELILMSSCEISNNKGNFIDEDNNVWAISSNYLFHWDLETSRLKFSYSLGFMATHSKTNNKLTVMSKGNYILVKHYDEIAIFSKGVHFPIRNIRLINSDMKIELCEVQNNVYLLAFNSPEKYTINIIYDITDIYDRTDIYDITDTNKQPVDASRIFNDENSENDSKNKFILCEYNSGSKKAFGLVDGKISCINLSDLNWHDFYESHKGEDDFICWNNYLCQTAFEKNYCNDTLAFPDMESIRSLFSKEHKNIQQINFDNQKYKWRISRTTNKLLVYTNEKVKLCSINIFKKQNSSKFQELKWKILNNNALALLDNKTIKIFEYNNNKEMIFLIEIISSIIEDERCLAKYGPTLLPNLIKSSDPELTRYIKDIYNKCMKLVKEDPKRNLKFLNIITSSMNDLHKKYPDHITKFNSEMFMLLDPFNEKIDDNDYSHFYPFCQEIKIVIFQLFLIFQRDQSKQRKQQIVLIVPYIDYCYYPFEYSGWKEIFYPQSSVFTDTCKKEFYTNWNGEAIINFKWNTFGRIYYFVIWLLFMVFLVCFTVASYPTLSITRDVRINLYQTSIAFGFFHIIFELRQFIWNPKKYFSSIWNLFDISAYLSVTITSIYYIKNDVTVVTPEWALLISCLLLDLKFLLFFKIFESFGVYFAIIFGVAKRVFSFLVVLAIIILSFAHAFFLLLHPEKLLDSLKAQNPNDSNNPWTLSNTYNQTDENGKILNETLIQVPDENTNLFYSYSTSLLATYLFLTGSQNSFSPWSPDPTSIGNTILFILMAVFSFLIVIYLMNLFIGLLNMAIEKDNDRASYLVQKAEVIAEIELFYLLPHQRRWKTWFPEVIYYTVEVEKARKYIREAIIKGEWKMDDWPEMKHKILKLLSIEDVIIDLAV